MSNIFSSIKRFFIPSKRRITFIPFGLLKGLKMELDFSCQMQLYFGLAERELSSHFELLSKGIEMAVDVGASEGFYTLYFLSKTSAKKIIAFEPCPESLKRLKENLRLNEYDKDKRLDIYPFYVGQACAKGFVVLDEFMTNVSGPILVKVDIEGGEENLLLGCSDLLSTRRARWIIEVHSLELENSCMKILEGYRYECTKIKNVWWRMILPEHRPTAHNRWLVATPT